MNRKKLHISFICLGAACLVFQFFRGLLPRIFSSAMAFPFEQTGFILRWLSLSGAAGNILAIILYVLICLVPAFLLFIISRRRKVHAEDWLLILLSAVLFPILYMMINPGIISFTPENIPDIFSFTKSFLGSFVYSVIISFILLRILRLFSDADGNRLQKYMSVLLAVLGAIFVCLAFGACTGDLISSIKAVTKANTGYEGTLVWTYVMLFFRYAAEALPYIFDIFIVLYGLNLLDEIKLDRYSEKAVTAAGRLSKLCIKFLGITVTISLVINILQFIFIKKILAVNVNIHIPVLSIAFILASLLLAQYIKENKALKDDNDMFI